MMHSHGGENDEAIAVALKSLLALIGAVLTQPADVAENVLKQHRVLISGTARLALGYP